MKTKLLIIIIIGVVAVTASVFALMKTFESDEIPEFSSFNYKKTEQAIDDTFLSKTVKEWQDVSLD